MSNAEFQEDLFAEALYHAVKLMALIYQEQEEWKRAAFMLSSFRFENHRSLSIPPADIVRVLVDCAETFLEAGEEGSASQQMKKAHAYVQHIQDKPDLSLRFKVRRLCHRLRVSQLHLIWFVAFASRHVMQEFSIVSVNS